MAKKAVRCPYCNQMVFIDSDGFCMNCGKFLLKETPGNPEKKNPKKEDSGTGSEMLDSIVDIGEEYWEKSKGTFAEFGAEVLKTLLGVTQTKIICANCKGIIDREDKHCKHCGGRFTSKSSTMTAIYCPKCKQHYLRGFPHNCKK